MIHALPALLLFALFLGVRAQDGNRWMPDVESETVKVRRGKMSGVDCQDFRFFNSYNGACTNPTRPNLGMAKQPLFSYFNKRFDASDFADRGLKSAREISNILCKQDEDNVFDTSQKRTEFVTFFGQFLDHSIVFTSVDKSSPKNIKVPDGDPLECVFSYLPFNRLMKSSKNGRPSGSWKRAHNCLPSRVDLFAVYGDEKLNPLLREKGTPYLKTSHGNLLPINDKTINLDINAPHVPADQRSNFFVAGDTRANENPNLISHQTLWMRNHNLHAKAIRDIFKDMGDDWCFEAARRVNQAQFQSIVYNEYLPAMIGKKLPNCKKQGSFFQCFNQKVDPSISDLFAMAGFRVGHSMVGGKVHRTDKNGRNLSPLNLEDAFFPTRDRIEADGIDMYLLGSIRNQAQKIDNKIVSALRNDLFKDVKEEDGPDLASLNIQRGRDGSLPSFCDISSKFNGRSVNSFSDISSNADTQNRLKAAYGTPGRVEAWPGLISEDHAPNSPMGRTLVALWEAEFRRLRDGDQLFYQNYQQYEPILRDNYRPLREIILGQGDHSMRKVILDNTDIPASFLPKSLWVY